MGVAGASNVCVIYIQPVARRAGISSVPQRVKPIVDSAAPHARKSRAVMDWNAALIVEWIAVPAPWASCVQETRVVSRNVKPASAVTTGVAVSAESALPGWSVKQVSALSARRSAAARNVATMAVGERVGHVKMLLSA